MDGWGGGVAGGVAQAEGREGEDASARIRMECCSGIIVLARYLNAANSNRTNLC
jgi:O-acetyl-ADP-ribose deacetylase (regulator of RNase III)